MGRGSAPIRRAFTLVELLVVIGIIALLMSVLLPALQSARQQANRVKCMSALREIGTANTMYVSENRGWAPIAKTTGAYRVSYTNLTPAYDDIGHNQYWYTLLAKYVTRSKQGYANSTDTDASRVTEKNVLWGCPAFVPYALTGGAGSAAGQVGGFYQTQTGYGFNAFPEYTTSYPAKFHNLGDSSLANCDDKFAIATPAPAFNDPTTMINGTSYPSWTRIAPPSDSKCTGKWYKWTTYSKQAGERMLVADGIFWLLESDLVPTGGPTKGERLAINAGSVIEYPSTGQSTYDMYRHGRYPGVENSGSNGNYLLRGGKISYNVLYCDGHVATLNDMESGFRAARLRYPG